VVAKHYRCAGQSGDGNASARGKEAPPGDIFCFSRDHHGISSIGGFGQSRSGVLEHLAGSLFSVIGYL
jgi:hypothetical protein